jgi:hypothetical protein
MSSGRTNQRTASTHAPMPSAAATTPARLRKYEDTGIPSVRIVHQA